MEMEEDRILAGFHQEVQKARDKAWHDRHIKTESFKEGDLVLVYDIKNFNILVNFEYISWGPMK
jgi:hypothetical protein